MSKVKNYYTADLFNIEEILSILEMRARVRPQDAGLKEEFVRFICDVVRHYTPTVYRSKEPGPRGWNDRLFGPSRKCWGYGAFVASLLNLTLWQDALGRLQARWDSNPDTRYSVITFNYDRVLEIFAEELDHLLISDPPIRFLKHDEIEEKRPLASISKLHGDVSGGVIVPPTWNKTLDDDILPHWRSAFDSLADANHIRFVGYSLPESDAYARFMFKSAVTLTERLKTLDVICLDPNGSVRERYDALVQFPRYRFVSGDVEHYLTKVLEDSRLITYPSEKGLTLENLELSHNEFMETFA